METTLKKTLLTARTAKMTVDVICYLFVLLFLYAAASKLLEYNKFQLQISKSPIITDFSSLLVWGVPGVEISISILLLVEGTRLLGLFAAFTLMLLFTFYIYAILNFSDIIPCSCGGVISLMSWNQHLVFNIAFIALALAGILIQTKINDNKNK